MRKVARILAGIFVLFFATQVNNVFAERKVVNNVPYIHQVQDMDDSKFLGYNACAPTSACMMLQFHNVQPKSLNSYAGWYVYNSYVGFADKSGRDYSTDKARDWDGTNEDDTYNQHNPHEVCGAHGFIVINTNPTDIKNPFWEASPGNLVSYLRNHGLTAHSVENDIFNVIKQNIDAGLPLIGHSRIYGKYGHYLVIIGYDTGSNGQETKVVVNDPYGNAGSTWLGGKNKLGSYITYHLNGYCDDAKTKHVLIDKVFEVGYNVVQFTGSSTIYLSSGGNLWPILSDKVYSLLGYRCGCTMTPDWSYTILLPLAEKSKYSIRDEVVPSENNSATGRMIAYRVVPKVGPTSCMCIDVDTARIYLFEDGKFRHIANEQVYKDLGYKADFSDVVNITPELFDYYGEGEEINESDGSGGKPTAYLEISGSTFLSENSSTQYTAVIRYYDGASSDVTNSAGWKVSCSSASISCGHLVSSSASEAGEVKATYDDKTATYPIVIGSPTPSRIEITGTTVVKENTGAQYTCTAYYDNGSSVNVTNKASWEETCGGGSIDQHGYFTASSVSSDETCEVKASYNGKTAAFLMNIQNVQILPGVTKTIFYVPEDYPTIQAAIDSRDVGSGYTIIVGDGICYENVDFKGKMIELMSKNGSAFTTIDGRGKGPVIKVLDDSGRSSEKPAVIEGFTIINGNADYGGGIYSIDSSLTIKNCIITKNKAAIGGGVYFRKYISALRDCGIKDCTIAGNEALTHGGGVYCKDSSLVIQGSEVSNNISDGTGGGIEVESKGPAVKIYNTTIKGNIARDRSGGVEFGECLSTDSEIANCRIEENRSKYAGGICVGKSPTKIINTSFIKNTASNDGGGIYYASSGSQDIFNCFVLGNRASTGGGMYFNSASPKIVNCTFGGNRADVGGAICGGYESSEVFFNNIVWDNGSSQLHIFRSRYVDVKYCDIQGGYPGEGNIDKDPLFVNAAKGDYHLKSTSPCVNAGTNVGAPKNDIDNDSRPQGSGYDIGADEHICVDTDSDGYYGAEGCGTEVDCDDTNSAIHPNTGIKMTYYPDADGDGYGNIDLPIQSCCPPDGYVFDNTDCKDTDPKINPGVKSICDGINNNCGWKVDEGFDVGESCSVGIGACSRIGKKVCKADGSGTVCNAIAGKPTAEIACDGIDNDCDGQVDEVKDKTPPKAIAKNITVQLGANGKAAITAADVNNGSSDNCGIAKMAVSPSSFAKVGSYKVTLTVTDTSGNKSSCKTAVKAEDKIPPVAKCKDITVQLNSKGKASIKAASVNNGSSDNCGIAKMTVSPSIFTSANIGTNTVALTVIDKSGNQSICTCTVTVKAYKK